MHYMRTSGSPETRNRRASALYITRISWIGSGSCRDSPQCGIPSARSTQLPPGQLLQSECSKEGPHVVLDEDLMAAEEILEAFDWLGE
jgi:hypothetical protein